jgi:gamma-glutamylcyclotransferase (GGCT)/AIG2-like uncharacterized protein YtfP
MMMRYLFVYGTLMSGCSNHPILEPYILSLRPAAVRGQIWHLPEGYPMLFDGSGQVYGELIQYCDEQEVLTYLDELEEYYGEGNENNYYERTLTMVTDLAGLIYDAWVYRCPTDKEAVLKTQGIFISSGDWRNFQQKTSLHLE